MDDIPQDPLKKLPNQSASEQLRRELDRLNPLQKHLDDILGAKSMLERLHEDSATQRLVRQVREMDQIQKALDQVRATDAITKHIEEVARWAQGHLTVSREIEALQATLWPKFLEARATDWLRDPALQAAQQWSSGALSVSFASKVAAAFDMHQPGSRFVIDKAVLDALAHLGHEEKEAAEQEAHTIASAAVQEATVQGVLQRMLEAIGAHAQKPSVQIFLLLALWNVLSNLTTLVLTPVADFYVKQHLEESAQKSAKNVKERVVQAVGGTALLADHRYVSARVLEVHQNPKALSPVVGKLRFGQAVRILKKDKDFTLVVWTNGETSIQGWVFSRHLKPFS